MVKFTLSLIISILLISQTGAYAQASLLEAQRQSELLNYSVAIGLYEKAFERRATYTAAQGLAESYRKVNNYAATESWYAKVVQMPDHTAMDVFYYAEALRNNSKYAEAKGIYESYLKEAGGSALPIIGQLVQSCDSAVVWMQHPVKYIFKLDSALNTPQSDWGVAKYQNGIVFSSDRIIDSSAVKDKRFLHFDIDNNLSKKVCGWTGLPYLKLFYAEKDGNGWKKVKPFSNTLNGEFHNGSVCFSKDGKEVFFTRTRFDKSNKKNKNYTIKLELYSSIYNETDSSWSAPIPFAYNSQQDYSVSDACLSNDGSMLYFASDMPEGQGGSDLYFCERQEDGSWGSPVNMKGFNTVGDERFPSFDNEGNFYFSSNGRVGLGGLDIYVVHTSDFNGRKVARNLGYPFNTPQDDFKIVFAEDDKSGFLSSNRTGGIGMDDVYQFAKKELKFRLEGNVFNKKTHKSISNAVVTLYNLKTNTELKIPTDEKGNFSFSMDENSDYTVNAEKTSFIAPPKDNLSTKGYKESQITKLTIGLDSIEFLLEGNVYNKKSNKSISNATVTLYNLKNNTELKAPTDENGYFAFNMDENTDYSINAEKTAYITPSKTTVSTKGFKESKVTKVSIGLDSIELNKGIRLDNIYYDYAKWNIREDAKKELNKLVQILNNNPTMIIELSSHTDSRGTDQYNMELSQKRAQSAVNYIISTGISPLRITAKGYGETRPVNKCTNGAKCSDQEFQENRRTEFAITKY
ncbi:OmpA family protein [Solitalea lacus]|uniref:OmpA family protein n=1 Tax=Solitalea lacus TaxID=2911172 RepID=UPI001EDC5771|nr:OmpA family protein [Solitalea lacus]UKJ06467.1 OmpA family protein [Solitalea lacus]